MQVQKMVNRMVDCEKYCPICGLPFETIVEEEVCPDCNDRYDKMDESENEE